MTGFRASSVSGRANIDGSVKYRVLVGERVECHARLTKTRDEGTKGGVACPGLLGQTAPVSGMGDFTRVFGQVVFRGGSPARWKIEIDWISALSNPVALFVVHFSQQSDVKRFRPIPARAIVIHETPDARPFVARLIHLTNPNGVLQKCCGLTQTRYRIAYSNHR